MVVRSPRPQQDAQTASSLLHLQKSIVAWIAVAASLFISGAVFSELELDPERATIRAHLADMAMVRASRTRASLHHRRLRRTSSSALNERRVTFFSFFPATARARAPRGAPFAPPPPSLALPRQLRAQFALPLPGAATDDVTPDNGALPATDDSVLAATDDSALAATDGSVPPSSNGTDDAALAAITGVVTWMHENGACEEVGAAARRGARHACVRRATPALSQPSDDRVAAAVPAMPRCRRSPNPR